jgi:hypothetical protein
MLRGGGMRGLGRGADAVADLARLLDGHAGYRWSAPPDGSGSQQAGEGAQQEQDQGHGKEAPEEGELVSGEVVVEQPGEADQRKYEGHHEEDPGSHADDRPAGELHCLLANLRLGKLYLLVDQERGAL